MNPITIERAVFNHRDYKCFPVSYTKFMSAHYWWYLHRIRNNEVLLIETNIFFQSRNSKTVNGLYENDLFIDVTLRVVIKTSDKTSSSRVTAPVSDNLVLSIRAHAGVGIALIKVVKCTLWGWTQVSYDLNGARLIISVRTRTNPLKNWHLFLVSIQAPSDCCTPENNCVNYFDASV